MPKLLLLMDNADRRELVAFSFERANWDVTIGEDWDSVLIAVSAGAAHLLIVEGASLHRLGELLCEDGQPPIPLITLVDPSNADDMLASLSARATCMIPRDRAVDDIFRQASGLMSNPRSVTPTMSADIPKRQTEFAAVDVIEALKTACAEIGQLQERYEAELVHRRKVQQALMESEAFYQSLVETLPLAMFRKDLQGRITFANRLMCQALHRPPEEIENKTDYDFFPRDLAEKYRADDRRVLEAQQDFETVEEFEATNGERRFTHVIKSPVYDVDHNVIGIQGIFSDVTERERAESELHHTRARLQAVMDAATQVSIVGTDVNGLIDVFNAGAERMLGYSAAEMIGLRTPAIFHLDTEVHTRGMELSAELGRTIAGFDVFVENARQGLYDEREWTYVRKNGSLLTVNLVVTARRNRHNEIEGFLGIATDISARKRAAEEMRRAKEAAEAASRAKSDFLANMSHEIRTPLNAVICLSELLLDAQLDATHREYVGMVQESGELLLGVINDILDFSKIEAGKLLLEELPFNLREVLGDTMKSLALRAHRKGVELACHFHQDVPVAVVGDPTRIRQIVINLVGNAIKFTEQGEVVLDVSVANETDRQFDLQLRVSDTGIGIPNDKLAAIFEAFEQVDNSTTRRYGGTGLGLAIVSRLTDLMGGKIRVESVVGQGSTFHVTIQCTRASEESIQSNETIYPPSLRGLRVLVVDDNATNRRILNEMLTNWGMHPVAVGSVEQAISELQHAALSIFPYSLILTDSNMPDHDGFELARQVQMNPSLCGSMIMMLTSGDRPEDLTKCRELGIASFLIKPVKQSELLDAIVRAVGSQWNSTESGNESVPLRRQTSRPLSILLAEDSLINQKLAIGLIERWGHRVTVANNGAEAVEMSNSGQFSLILMDVQMPEMDGLDATRAIRQREQTTGIHLPIIAMTAHAMKGDRERCLDSGMDNYLMKPIRSDELFRTIESIANLETSLDGGNGTEDTSKTGGQAPSAANATTTPSVIPVPQRQDASSSTVDWTQARQAVNGDEGLLTTVLAAFLEEGPQLVTMMLSSVQSQEWKRFQRAAHTLKSALRTFGVPLADAVEQLELAAKSPTPVVERTTVESVCQKTAPVFEEIRRHLKMSKPDNTR